MSWNPTELDGRPNFFQGFSASGSPDYRRVSSPDLYIHWLSMAFQIARISALQQLLVNARLISLTQKTQCIRSTIYLRTIKVIIPYKSKLLHVQTSLVIYSHLSYTFHTTSDYRVSREWATSLFKFSESYRTFGCLIL